MSLAYDKKLHLAAGAIVAWAAYMLAQPGLVLEPLLALLQVERGTLAALAALAAGLAKEGFDWFHQDVHTVDPMDAVATFFPGLLVFVGDWAFYHLTIPQGLV